MGQTTKTGRPSRPPQPWESALWSARVAQAYERIDKEFRARDAAFIAETGRDLYDFGSAEYLLVVARSALDEADEAYQAIMTAYWRRHREREEKAKAAVVSGGAR